VQTLPVEIVNWPAAAFISDTATSVGPRAIGVRKISESFVRAVVLTLIVNLPAIFPIVPMQAFPASAGVTL